jgi:hypothetical protein
VVVGFFVCRFRFLIFFSAPASLSKLFGASLIDDFLPQALVGLLRRDVVDARMVMLRVIPGKVSFEIGDGLVVIQESPGIRRGAFDGAEGGFDERIVIGGAGAGKQLGQAVIFTQPLDRLGFHLAAAIIDDFGPLVLGQVQDVLIGQTALQQEPGFLGGLLPVDAPLDGFAGPFIQQQVEVEIHPFLEGHQVADVPTPPLVGPGQFFADRGLGVPVVSPAGPSRRHQVPRLENAVDGGEGGLKQALIPSAVSASMHFAFDRRGKV